uniref:L3MBTL histone methyl-lysine binding protein 3 n=1 Tax=Sphenodon punctatus TaxID=8508 RepID=A0A8D0GUH7_SPHPU
MNEPASSGSGQEFDVFSAMDWKDGIVTLPGSDLKFRVNEFGALEVITDETEMESVKKATATTTWMVWVCAGNAHPSPPIPGGVYMDGLIFCENCYHYGTIEEFVPGGKFCSQKCAHQIKHKEPKEDKDVSECNGEEYSKSTRKRKIKLPLKGESMEDGEEKKERVDETVSIFSKTLNTHQFLLCQLHCCIARRAQHAGIYSEISTNLPFSFQYQSFPYNKNGFKIGMKLEGVDPEHQSIYCILTVAEVCGYRIKLHFDGYSDYYDFWVNADSSDIHPVGWCEKTGHKLHPPKGYKEDEFNWPSYLKTCKAQAAPKSLFENQNMTVIPSGFRVGMKLEAVDKKNPTFICVATVTDMVDNRFLVHFDNWDESYDYWCEAASPHIHPVGWCKEHRRTLITPPDYPHAKHFSWEKYLEETSSLPAPARAFKVVRKSSHGFQKNMRLEVVDKRNPVLIRVATVVDTDDHRIKVHFDGWDSVYDYWIDADSPDIHPAGWCTKTGHILQPPLSPLELVEALEQGGCPTAGCKGVGHIKRARHTGHHSAVSCPYSEINLNKGHILPDRLSGVMPPASPSVLRNRKTEVNEISTTRQEDTESKPPCKKPFLSATELLYHVTNLDVQQVILYLYVTLTDIKELRTQNPLPQPVILSSKLTIPCLPLRWEQQSKLLPSVAGIPASKVSKWSTDEVSEFIRTLPGCEEHGRVFKDEQIDGEAFLLMTQTDIVKIMSIKLGPALKIFNSILMFKASEKNSHNEL